MTHTIKRLNLYVDNEAGSVTDVGYFRLEGYTLIADNDLKALQAAALGEVLVKGAQEVVDALQLAQFALITPGGTFKTKKARAAFEAIQKILGEDDEQS
jgi:hypothetical protein